jgi:hypothetical protein
MTKGRVAELEIEVRKQEIYGNMAELVDGRRIWGCT